MGAKAFYTTSGRFETLIRELAVNVSVFRAFRITDALSNEMPTLEDNHAYRYL